MVYCRYIVVGTPFLLLCCLWSLGVRVLFDNAHRDSWRTLFYLLYVRVRMNLYVMFFTRHVGLVRYATYFHVYCTVGTSITLNYSMHTYRFTNHARTVVILSTRNCRHAHTVLIADGTAQCEVRQFHDPKRTSQLGNNVYLKR